MTLEFEEEIKRLREKANELHRQCNDNAQEAEACPRIRIIFSEIMTDVTRVLDRAFQAHLQNAVFPTCTTVEKKKYESATFPIARDQEHFDQIVKSNFPKNFHEKYPTSYKLLEIFQPFVAGREYWRLVKDLSNDTHRSLIRQNVNKEDYLNIGGFVRAKMTGSVKMKNVMMGGMPIESLEVRDGQVKGIMDARIPLKKETLVTYVVEGTQLNIIDLSNQAINSLHDYLRQLFKEN